jgi:hypothetical protein
MARRKKAFDPQIPDELSPDFLRSVGGRRLALAPPGSSKIGGGDVWNFGWIPPESRTEVQHAANHAALADMPRFAIDGSTRYPTAGEPEKVELYKIWDHPSVVEKLGFPWIGTKQFSGSCVWAGAQNVMCTLHFIDVLQKGDAEELYVPFGLLAYGRSRFYMGDRNPGEGSLGSTYAKAARDDGFLNAKQDGLPPFKSADGIEWGSRSEMSWSDGDAQQVINLLPESRKRLVKTTARCRSADDVREAIVNGYPVTCASMYAHRPRVESDPAVLLGRRSGSWAHQMSILAWWVHPKLGELFWLQNQWGLNAHGRDPAGGPPGGVWIMKSDVDWICRDEVFAFSQYEGFPAPLTPIPWIF